MTAEQFIPLCLSFLVGIQVLRYLGPEAIGAINYAAAVGGLLSPIASLGLEAIIIRELVKCSASRSKTWQTARKLLWAATAVNILAVSFLSLTKSSSGLIQFALLATAVSGLSNLATIHLWAFRAASKYREIAKIRLAQTIAIQAIRLVMIYLEAPFIVFVTIIALDPLILAITTQRLAKTRIPYTTNHDTASLSEAKTLLAESWPIILTSFGIMIYTRIDVVMLEHLSGTYNVGIYSAATRISELWNILPVVLVKAAYPRLVYLSNNDQNRYTKVHQCLFLTFASMAVIVGVFTQIGAYQGILFLYGQNFIEAANSLKIHVWSALPVFIGVLISNSYQIFQVTKPLMWGCLIGSVSNIILNLLWIPVYGPNGAAGATAVSYTLSVITPLLFSKNCREIAMGKIPITK
jgi:polysaccharide transporter, PST family